MADKKSSTGNKTSKFFFFLILAVMVVGVNAFIWSNFFKTGPPETKPIPKSAPALTQSSDEAEKVLAARTADETSLIKLAVFTKTGLDDMTAEWTILNKANNYAAGNLSPKSGGKKLFWWATKNTKDWECIYANTDKPKCSELASYNFPKDMIFDCL